MSREQALENFFLVKQAKLSPKAVAIGGLLTAGSVGGMHYMMNHRPDMIDKLRRGFIIGLPTTVGMFAGYHSLPYEKSTRHVLRGAVGGAGGYLLGRAIDNATFPIQEPKGTVKEAASLKTLQHAVSKHRGKFLDLSDHMDSINSSLGAIKNRMNHIVTSSGGKLTSQNKAEWKELNKMRQKLIKFKSPRMQNFSAKAIPDFHGGAWKDWMRRKGQGMSPETRSVLQEGANTFGKTMEHGIRQTKGGRALTKAQQWDDVVNLTRKDHALRRYNPKGEDAKSFMSTNANLHEVDELVADRAVAAKRRRKARNLMPSQINKNHHMGLNPILNDMNRANTATGVGSVEFRGAMKKQRWDELDFLEKVLPAESAQHITTLKRGGRISRHAKKRLNRDWAAYARRHGSEHSHESAFTKLQKSKSI